MSSSSRPAAAKAWAALFAVALAGAAWGPGRAAPPGPAPALRLELEVYLNGVDTRQIAAFEREPDGTMRAAPQDLAEIGFSTNALKPGPDRLIPLDQVQGLSFRYDEASQSIFLTARAGALASHRIDARTNPPAPPAQPSPLGAALDYTLYGVAAPDARGVGATLSAELDGRLFGPFGVLSSTGLASLAAGSPGRMVRLDTTWTWDDPAHLVTYRAGDVVSGGLAWTRPIYMGGVQVARSFDLRPDLVTMPVPTLSGSALTPSTLDLYVNGAKALTTAVQPGPFQIDQAPVSDGAGDVQVVVTDALGRQTRVDLPFYTSENLLRPGLVDFSVEAGFARRNLGTASADYDAAPAFSGSARAGLTDALTVEAHAEAAGGFAEAGGGVTGAVGAIGTASLALAGSEAAGRGGTEVAVGFETRRRAYSVTVRMLRTFGDYEDLASWTAQRPPGALQPPAEFRPPSEIDQVSLGAPAWSSTSLVAITLARLVEGAQRSDVASAYLSQRFGPVTLYLSGTRDYDTRDAWAATLTATVPFGPHVNIDAGLYEAAGEGVTAIEDASSDGPKAPGDMGWRVQLAEGARNQATAEADYLAQAADLQFGAQYSNGRFGAFGQVSGSVAAVGGGLFASRRLGESFAVVDVGASGVAVAYENRPQGLTGANGKLLIPELVPYQANRIDVDPANLPPDAELDQAEFVVAPRQGAAVIVKAHLQRDADAALVSFVTAGGEPIEAGARARLTGGARTFPIGYGGEAFLKGLTRRNVVVIERPNGGACRAVFDFKPVAGVQARLRGIACDRLELSDDGR